MTPKSVDGTFTHDGLTTEYRYIRHHPNCSVTLVQTAAGEAWISDTALEAVTPCSRHRAQGAEG